MLESRAMMAGDTISLATPLGSIGTSRVAVSESISPDTNVDMYGFSVGAGQTITFNINTPLNGPGGLGSFLRLFNSQGTQLAFNDDGAAPGENLGFDSYLRYTFTNAGTYYLGVSNNTNTGYNAVTGNGDTTGGLFTTGTYELVVQGLLADLDDTLAASTLLGAITTTAKTSSASIDPDTDVDMYRFTVTAGQTVDFNINTTLNGPGGLGSYIRLFNNSGTQIAFNNDAAAPGETLGFDSFLRHTFSAAGTYFLGVSNFNNTLYNPSTGGGDFAGGFNATGAYELVIQALGDATGDSDDTLLDAIPLGVVSTASITRSDSLLVDVDVNMYSFTVATGQTVTFNINTALNGPNGLGSFLRLFNSQGAQLAFNDDGAAPGENLGFDAFLRYTFATAGTYFLGVSNFNNTSYNAVTGNGDTIGGLFTTGAYTLIVQGLIADLDDTLATANNLGPVTTAAHSTTATIDPDTDVDVYQFTVTAGQSVDFNINTPLNGTGGLGSYIRLFNSSGVQLAFNNDAAAPGETLGFDSYLRYTFTTAGTYYLGVSNLNNTLYSPTTGTNDTSGGFNATGAYSLIVQTAPTSSFPLHNEVLAEDVSGEGNVTALDALTIINHLSRQANGLPNNTSGPPFSDVNRDNLVTASDALAVINYLNRTSTTQRELEQFALSSSATESLDTVFRDPSMEFNAIQSSGHLKFSSSTNWRWRLFK